MKLWSFRIGIATIAMFFLFSLSGGAAFGWNGHGYRGYHGHYRYAHGYHGDRHYGHHHHHGYHHYGDYWGGLALGFGLGVITPYLFPAPYAYNPPVAYAPAPRPRYRVLACEPKHYVEETRWDGRQQRYVLTRQYFPERCWYEYR